MNGTKKVIFAAAAAGMLAGAMTCTAAEQEKVIEIKAPIEKEVSIVNSTALVLDGVCFAEEKGWGENLLEKDVVVEAGQTIRLIPDEKEEKEEKAEEEGADFLLSSGEKKLVFWQAELEEAAYTLAGSEEITLAAGTEAPVADAKAEDALNAVLEIWYKEPAVMYAMDNVNLREIPSTDGEILGTAFVGEELSVTGECEGWVIAEREDAVVYISSDYVTSDQAEAQAAAEAEAARIAEEEAAAQAEYDYAGQSDEAYTYAEPAYSEPVYTEPAYSEPAAPETPQVYEVGRQAFDDCDGSGHGYYLITYSDGSTAIEEY